MPKPKAPVDAAQRDVARAAVQRFLSEEEMHRAEAIAELADRLKISEDAAQELWDRVAPDLL